MVNEENLDQIFNKILEMWSSAEEAVPQGVESLITNIQTESYLSLMTLFGIPSVILGLLVISTVALLMSLRKNNKEVVKMLTFIIGFLILAFLISCAFVSMVLPEIYAAYKEPAGWVFREYLSN